MVNEDVAAMVVIAIIAIIFMPLGVIWAVNTLFGASIVYTFWNWLATLILCSVVSPKPSLNNNKN